MTNKLFRKDMLSSLKAASEKAREIDRGFGIKAERVSLLIWPWPEMRLLVLIGSLAFLDFASTYYVLELSGKANVSESGSLALWSLDNGGFLLLFIIDLLAAVFLALIALGSRHLYAKMASLVTGAPLLCFFLYRTLSWQYLPYSII